MPERNHELAEKLREIADLLALQEANPYRVGAYRRAAETLEALDEDVGARLDRRGLDGLTALAGIDYALASMMREWLCTRRLSLLERLRGASDPERLFQTVPGVGPRLARAIHEMLHVDTLDELEAAAHDGRLATVSGLGPRRARGIAAALAGMLGHTHRGAPDRPRAIADEPPVALLLDVDREYRTRAERGELRTIAPRRLNPEGRSWLPILHTQRGPWHFTALFSNTARAHELGRTQDWVILYFFDARDGERQRTVVTETHGGLAGRRVVRGREPECARLVAEATERAQ